MSNASVIDIAAQAFVMVILLSGPAILVSLLVGFIAALLQTVTSIQEQTLSMVPKTLAIFIILIVTGPWMLALLVDFFTRLFHSIPGLV